MLFCFDVTFQAFLTEGVFLYFPVFSMSHFGSILLSPPLSSKKPLENKTIPHTDSILQPQHPGDGSTTDGPNLTPTEIIFLDIQFSGLFTWSIDADEGLCERSEHSPSSASIDQVRRCIGISCRHLRNYCQFDCSSKMCPQVSLFLLLHMHPTRCSLIVDWVLFRGKILISNPFHVQ